MKKGHMLLLTAFKYSFLKLPRCCSVATIMNLNRNRWVSWWQVKKWTAKNSSEFLSNCKMSLWLSNKLLLQSSLILMNKHPWAPKRDLESFLFKKVSLNAVQCSACEANLIIQEKPSNGKWTMLKKLFLASVCSQMKHHIYSAGGGFFPVTETKKRFLPDQ